MQNDFSMIRPLIGQRIIWDGLPYIVAGIYVDEHGSECVALLSDAMLKMVHYSRIPVIYEAVRRGIQKSERRITNECVVCGKHFEYQALRNMSILLSDKCWDEQ
jgi:hypothetical protein